MAPKSKNFLNFIVSFLQRFLGFSCEAASPGLRASERASKPEREEGVGGGGRTQTATDRGRAGSRAGTWEAARSRGAGGPGTEPRGPGAGSRAGGAEGALSRWRRRSSESGVAEAERSEGRSSARLGGERGASREPPAAALEKAGSGGVATRCSRSPFPPSPPPGSARCSRARGRKGGGGERERRGRGGEGARRHRLGPQPPRTEGGTGRAEWRMQSRVAGFREKRESLENGKARGTR